MLCFSLRLSQNHLPRGFAGEVPNGILYYSPNHIQEMERNRDLVEQLSSETGVLEVTGHGGVKIIISDLIDKINQDLTFSKSVHKQMGI